MCGEAMFGKLGFDPKVTHVKSFRKKVDLTKKFGDKDSSL